MAPPQRCTVLSGRLIGILGARMGMPVMDPLASFIICIFIVKAALDVFRDSMDKMVDKACDDETVRSIEQAVLDTRGVERVGSMKTRLFRFQNLCGPGD